MKKIISIIFVFLTLSAFPQDNKLDLYNLNFIDLAKLKIVTASKIEQNLSEVPATIRIITASEISAKGYFTLDEMLSDLPGFQFRNIMSLNSYIFQRGIPNQNNLTLVLVDGVQMNELNSGGFYGGGQYDISDIERVEVVSGPSSVVYGTNAVSGVINIITRKAKKNQGEIGTLAGNFNTLSSNVWYTFFDPKTNLGLKISGMMKRSDKANLKGAAGDYNWTDLMDNYENDYSVGIKLDYNGFTFGSNLLQKQTSTTTFQKSAGTNYRDYGTFWNIGFWNTYLNYKKSISDKLSLSSIVYYRNTTVDKNTIYYVLDTAQVGYYRPNSQTGFETMLNYNSQKYFSVSGGFVFKYEQLANGPSLTYSVSENITPPTPPKPSMINDYLVSAFVEPRLVLFHALFLSGGVRFDQSSSYNQVITPMAGLRYNLEKVSFRVSYADAFRAPKPWDYTDGIGNQGLLPEKMGSLEASISLLMSKKLDIDLTAYRNRLLNSFVKDYSGSSYQWVNSGKTNTNGLEFSCRYSVGKADAVANYTYTNSSDEDGKQIPEISKHCFNAGVNYSLGNRWAINLRANYVGARDNPTLITATGTTKIDPYLIFNGALTWLPLTGLRVQFIGKNLFDAEYYHTSNRSPERYRQPQRTIMFSVSYCLNEK